MGTAAPRTRRLVDLGGVQPPGDRPYDYSDAFEVRVADVDRRSAEQWARSALEESPAALRRAIVVIHRHVLRFRLGPLSAPDHVLGWRVVGSVPDEVQLEAVGPLGRAVIIGRRSDPRAMLVATFVCYRQRRARAVWAVIAPIHRAVAPYLLKRAGRAADVTAG